MAKKYSFSNERREGFGNLVFPPKKISGRNSKVTVVALNVAVNSQNVDQDGDVIDRADFYNIKLFNRDAELALANLDKGDRIHFKGRVFPTEYINKDDEIVESVEINADMGEVYPAPLWESLSGDSDDERPSRRRKSSKRKASAKRRRKDDEEAQDWDDDEDLDEGDDDDLGDDFDEDPTPKRKSRSRTRSRSRKKTAEVDDDADEYEDLI